MAQPGRPGTGLEGSGPALVVNEIYVYIIFFSVVMIFFYYKFSCWYFHGSLTLLNGVSFFTFK